MLNEPIMAKDLKIQIFSSRDFSGKQQLLVDEINHWFARSPNTRIYDVFYHHSTTPKDKDVFSVAFLFSF